jgi:hypothetical protein
MLNTLFVVLLAACILPVTATAQLAKRATSFLAERDSAYTRALDTMSVASMTTPSAMSDVHFVLEMAAADLERLFDLPFLVRLTGRRCGRPNAFYSSATRTITLCYELRDGFQMSMNALRTDDSTRNIRMIEALFGAVAHEAGHAIVDVLQLPTLGRREDVADQFAALFLLELDAPFKDEPLRYNALRALTHGMLYLADGENASTTAALGTHPLAIQRSANISCWTVGFGAKHGLPPSFLNSAIAPERVSQCPGEYADLRSGWIRLLGPTLRYPVRN